MATNWIVGGSKEYFAIAAVTDLYMYLYGRGVNASGASANAAASYQVKSDYTWSRLYTSISLNTYDGAFTIKSHIDTGGGFADGNQVVTIPAATTGTFEDTTHSDALSDGDYICWHLHEDAAAGGARILFTHSLFNNANTYSFQGAADTLTLGTDTSVCIGGQYTSATESDVQFTARVAGTIDYFRVTLVTAAGTDRTIYVRKNGGNTAITVTITAGTSGEYTDYANSFSFVSGDTLDIRGTGVSGSVYTLNYSFRLNSGYRFSINSNGMTVGTLNNVTCYLELEGESYDWAGRTVEGNYQFKIPATMYAQKLFVKVRSNTHDVADTIRTRKNGANGALSVSIPATTTGDFEDTANTDSLVDGDLFCYQGVFANGAGSIYPTIIGVSMTNTEPPTPATGTKTSNSIKLLCGVM